MMNLVRHPASLARRADDWSLPENLIHVSGFRSLLAMMPRLYLKMAGVTLSVAKTQRLPGSLLCSGQNAHEL